MINVSELRKVFKDKLNATDNMDAAFVKAVWVAYLQGLKDAEVNNVVVPEQIHDGQRTK
jgi:hypothetical protein